MLAIYTRLSREEEDSNSIKNQIREGKSFAKNNEFKSTKIYNEGEGISGTLNIEDRPKLLNLVADIKAGLINSVWLRNQNRLDRNTATFIIFVTACRKNEVDVYFGDSEKLDFNDPTTELQSTILSTLNQYQARLQSIQTKRALRDNAQEGKVWGVIPYGYRTDDKSLPFIDENESKIIKRIFNEYLNGSGRYKISNKLNKDGVPTKYHQWNKSKKLKNKYNKKINKKRNKDMLWTDKTIGEILENTWYIGTRTYAGEQYDVPQIIDETLFNKVQKAIQARKGVRTSTPKYKYLLKGLIRCQRCERNYYGRFRPSGKDNHYMCSSKRKTKTNCGNAGINIPALDSFLIRHLFKSKDLVKMMESILSNDSAEIELKTKLRTTNNYISETDKKIKRYAKLLGDLDDNDGAILKEYNNANNLFKRLKEEVSQIELDLDDLNGSRAFNNYKEQIENLNLKSDFNILKMAVDNIIEEIKIESYETQPVSYSISIAYKGFNDYTMWNTQQPYDKWYCTLDTHNAYNLSCGIPTIYSLKTIELDEKDFIDYNKK